MHAYYHDDLCLSGVSWIEHGEKPCPRHQNLPCSISGSEVM